MKILIDSRRAPTSGIGRVTAWLSTTLAPELSKTHEVALLVSPATEKNCALQRCKHILWHPDLFSAAEFYDLPRLLEKHVFDLYINPHITWSPLHTVPSINIIHDLWTIERPELLPTASDLGERFGVSAMEYGKEIINWWQLQQKSALLTDMGQQLYERAVLTNHKLLIGSWAQYAAIASQSAQVVCVSQEVHNSLCCHFKLKVSAKVIPNVPQKLTPSLNLSRSHFLVLSKLEKRKGLDRILDAYIAYCERSSKPFGLRIAGEVGYPAVALEIISKIHQMQRASLDIEFVGVASEHRLGELAADAVAIINASVHEGFGLPTLEGAITGIPVISTVTGEIGTKFRGSFYEIDMNSVTSLADAMFVLENTEPQPSLLAKLASTVGELYNSSFIVQQWVDVVHQCCQE